MSSFFKNLLCGLPPQLNIYICPIHPLFHPFTWPNHLVIAFLILSPACLTRAIALMYSFPYKNLFIFGLATSSSASCFFCQSHRLHTTVSLPSCLPLHSCSCPSVTNHTWYSSSPGPPCVHSVCCFGWLIPGIWTHSPSILQLLRSSTFHLTLSQKTALLCLPGQRWRTWGTS